MRKKRSIVAVALGFAAVLVTPVIGLAQSSESAETATYLVVLDDAAGPARTMADTQSETYGGEVKGVWEHALDGYSAEMTAAEAAELSADPSVASVEQEEILHISQEGEVPTGVGRIFGPENPHLGIGGPDDVRVDADIAIIDTGVADHPDLNVAARHNCIGGSCSDGGSDDNGHGTHVAGSSAAINNGSGVVGVAPGARLHAFKVCDASGSCPTSAIVAAADAVAADAATFESANMSLGGPGSDSAMENAIQGGIDAGVVFAVAAGNDSQDASGFTPARMPDAITVSALADSDGAPGGTGGSPSCRADEDDSLANFSNFGTIVDIAAPGVCINSSWNDGGFNTISGTSMATPHVTGAAAILAAADKPANRDGVLALADTMTGAGNTDWSDESGDGELEPLLEIQNGDVFNPGGGGEPGTPTAAFEATCSEDSLACDFDGSGSTDPDGSISGYEWDFGDGATGTGAQTSHTYGEADTYTVTLTVTDDAGLTDTASKTVQVGPPPANQPPTASFAENCFGFGFCLFDGTGSSDADGSIASWEWDFGDGATGSGDTVFHGYGAPGTYTVTLTVTDDGGATTSVSKDVVVS